MIEIPLVRQESRLSDSKKLTHLKRPGPIDTSSSDSVSLISTTIDSASTNRGSNNSADGKDYVAYEIANHNNVQYHGTLYLGSNHEPHEFIFDTGSPWLWTASTACRNQCHTNTLYDA